MILQKFLKLFSLKDFEMRQVSCRTLDSKNTHAVNAELCRTECKTKWQATALFINFYISSVILVDKLWILSYISEKTKNQKNSKFILLCLVCLELS